MSVRFIVMILLFASCKADDKPAGVLKRDQMVKVLVDIYIAEDKVKTLSLTNDSAKIVFDKFKEKIFHNVEITDSVFQKSMNYYIDRPKELEKIYTALVDSLNLKEQRSSFAKPAK